jgi:hypothetical protein
VAVPDEMIEQMRARIDSFARTAHRYGVAAMEDGDAGVPPEMQEGPINSEGWVAWRVLPSSLDADAIAELERETGARFPTPWKAYLLARAHLFDQLHSRASGQLVFWTATPSNDPLGPAAAVLDAYAPLLGAGYLPFAEWGDGWGPMCFDLAGIDGEPTDAPIVWLDHEALPGSPAGAGWTRARLAPLAQPLYPGIEPMLDDVMPFASE